jgi:hypothetical protein
MHAWLDPGVRAMRSAADLVLGAWGGAVAAIDAYEAAVAAAVAAQRDLARGVGIAPVRSLLAMSADLTRDIAALQASAARWALDP